MIAEDERDVAELIRYHLAKEGWDAVVAPTGPEALRQTRELHPDLILLDLMIPQLNGWEVCRRLKQDLATRGIPVIMVTARVEEGDKVLGFELGADDYVTKPFSVRELVARIRAVIRRTRPPEPREKKSRLKVGDLVIDRHRFEVTMGGRAVELTPKEFELLATLAGEPGRVFGRDELLDLVWGQDGFVEPRTVDVHLARLRSKFTTAKLPEPGVDTVRGVGYRFREGGGAGPFVTGLLHRGNPAATRITDHVSRRKEKTMKLKGILTGVASLLTAGAGPAMAQVQVDPGLAPYKAVSGVSGNVSSVGSDTLNNLMTLWAEQFGKFYPNVKIQIEGKGSSTAPPALIAGTAQFGPMSREMKGTEVDAFEKKYGYKPTPIRTSVDALAVFVNKDNPIRCLNFQQVDAVFSKSRRLGGKDDIKTWGQLGLTGEWADRPISLYGRNSASGTYGFFKEHALKNGDYKDGVKEQPGSAAVVQGVTVDRYAMGYSGIGYATAGVRAVPLSEKEGGKCVEATADNSYSGAYPLARFLYVYINKAPGKGLDPVSREFVKLIASKDGQEVVVKDGYFPIPASIAKEELNKVQ